MTETKSLPAMTPVESSNIKAVGYDPDAHAMHVQFKSGGHYRYAGVPKAAHEAFMAAPSKGSHFAQNVAGKFEHTKVPDAG